MKHWWIGWRGCVERCYYCGIRRDEAKCGECMESDIKRKRQEENNLIDGRSHERKAGGD